MHRARGVLCEGDHDKHYKRAAVDSKSESYRLDPRSCRMKVARPDKGSPSPKDVPFLPP